MATPFLIRTSLARDFINVKRRFATAELARLDGQVGPAASIRKDRLNEVVDFCDQCVYDTDDHARYWITNTISDTLDTLRLTPSPEAHAHLGDR
jgi:hypothetical protein